MRATSLIAWPLQRAFAHSHSGATLLQSTRGVIGVPMRCVFHTLGGGTSHRQRYPKHDLSSWRQRLLNGVGGSGAAINARGPRRLIVRCLNRIMLEPSEVDRDEDGRLFAALSATDGRTAHVRSVLKGNDGQSVRVGVVDAGVMDDASISWREPVVAPGGAPPPDIPGRKKDRKAASEWRDLVLDLGTSEQLLDRVPDERRPKVALMLALPRPLQLERILPMVSSLGVTTLVLCTASKVEKMYFGSHLFRDPESMRERLVEGLSQCGDTVLPEVVVARHLKVFLQDDLERLFPKNRWVRTVAHPTRLPAQKEFRVAQATPGAVEDERQADGHVKTTPASGLRFADVVPPKGCDPSDAGVLVTVGPEGGWVEPNELELLESFGFQAVTLGPRVLRSDVAVCALLALAHAWVEERTTRNQSGATPLSNPSRRPATSPAQ